MSNIQRVLESLKDSKKFKFDSVEEVITDLDVDIKAEFGDDKPEWYDRVVKALKSAYKRGEDPSPKGCPKHSKKREI
jgi:hypothetical protein